jgi:hypothetical protein
VLYELGVGLWKGMLLVKLSVYQQARKVLQLKYSARCCGTGVFGELNQQLCH